MCFFSSDLHMIWFTVRETRNRSTVCTYMNKDLIMIRKTGALMNYPCLFCPSDNFGHCLVLPTRSRASVGALFYRYLSSNPRCEMNRKVHAPRRVSASGAPHNVTWTKLTWIKNQCKETVSKILRKCCTKGTQSRYDVQYLQYNSWNIHMYD